MDSEIEKVFGDPGGTEKFDVTKLTDKADGRYDCNYQTFNFYYNLN